MSDYIVDPQETVGFRTWGGFSVANATSASTTIIGSDLNTTNGFTFPVHAGDLMILAHTVDRGANLASLGAPNTVGNPWVPIPNAAVDYGGGDGPKIRMWKKFATATDQGQNSTYTVTSAVASWHQLFVTIIPAGLIDPNAAIVAATSTRFGLPHTHPQLAIPSGYKTRERCYGLAMGLISASTRSAKGWTPPDFNSGDSYETAGWYGFVASVQGTSDDRLSNDLYTFGEFSAITLDPAKSVPASGPVPSGASGPGQCPTVSVSLLLLPWSSYQSPTAGLMSGLSDNFSTPLDSRVTTIGTPTINGSNQLVLHGGDSVTYAGVRSMRESQVTIEVPQAAVTGSDSVQLLMQSQLWPAYNRITVYTSVNPSTGVCNLVAGNIDNLYGGAGYYRGAYDPVAMRWWRVRVEGAVLLVDTSPDKTTWFTQFEGSFGPTEGAFGFLQDQLDDMQLTLRVVGSSSTTAIFDNLGQPFLWQADTVPSARTTAWQGYTSALKTTWHGRDVLVGICDQGTSQAVRTAQNITMVNRKYFASTGPPGFGNGETFPGEPHGCFVTSNGVPTGGKHVEAVITAYSGSTSTSIICQALLWCAAQGAKVINLSFGGGADDQVFRDTFSYLASAYDVQIFIAAGNSNFPYVEIPSAYSTIYQNVHSVGAFDEITGLRAYFSDYQREMSGVAPGLNVTGLSPAGRPLTGSGTSYASPLSMQLAARLLTGGTRSPATIGRVLDTYTRTTASPAAEQGGGAYDLGLAATNIDAPPKTLLPDIAMPRFTDGQWADVAEGFDEMAQAVDLKGTTCLVRRLDAGNLPNNFHAQINWEYVDVDTIGGMFSLDNPYYLTIRTSGLYELTLQVRYFPFSSGSAAAAIMLNGLNVATDAVTTDRKPWSTDGEGVTNAMTCVAALIEGDYLACDVWQNSGATLLAVGIDFGGTFLSATRLAPLAPTLSGTATPVTGLTVTASSYNTVSLAWTNASGDQNATLIRRKTGTAAPTGITDGTAIGTVTPPASTLVDSAVAPSTTYSYAAFARSSSYVYADPATVTVTTPAAPSPPGPITGFAVTSVSTSTLGLTWTNPTSSNFAGTMIRRTTGTAPVGAAAAVAATPPTGPTDGTLIADLAPGTTSYTNAGLAAQTPYAYAAFSHTSDPVYAAGATASRATTVDITVHGSVAPTLTSIRSDGPYQVGIQFSVSAAAWFKAFRFYRANSTILGPFQFALWDVAIIYGGTPPSGVTSGGLVIGTNVTYNPNTATGWVTAAPTTVPVLAANRAYIAAVYVPKGLPEYRPFWAGTGAGASGLFSQAGTFTMTAPSRANAAYTHAQETYNTSTTACPTTDGGTDGPCWFIDPLVNPVT